MNISNLAEVIAEAMGDIVQFGVSLVQAQMELRTLELADCDQLQKRGLRFREGCRGMP